MQHAAPKSIGHKVLRPRQQVEHSLRSVILDGDVKAGEKLPTEAELARQFGVSRPTIREALSALESQGLINKVPGAGGGSFVQAVDSHALGQVMQESMHNLLELGSVSFEEVAMVRQHLEVPAVMLACEHRTEAEVAELKDILEGQRTRAVDDPAIRTLDAQFHTAIARMSGNRILASLVHALHSETEPATYVDISPEVGRVTFGQHVAIVRAIENRDAAAGSAAITEHLTYLREHLLVGDK